MGLVYSQESLTQGVTRQPTKQRPHGVCREQDNIWATYLDGARKRHPLDWLFRAALSASAEQSGDPMLHIIDKGPSQKYGVIVNHRHLQAYDLQTRKRIKIFPQAGAVEESNFDYMAGFRTSAHSKDILDQKTPEDLSNNMGVTAEVSTSGAPDVTKSWKQTSTVTSGGGTITPEYAGTGTASPGPFVGKAATQLLKVSKSIAGNAGEAFHYYRFIQADEGGAASEKNRFPQTGRWTRWSAIVHQETSGVANADMASVAIYDATANAYHRAQWAWSGNALTSLTPTITGSAVARATDLRNGFYLLQVAHRSTLAEFAANDERRVGFFWSVAGAQLDRRMIVTSVLLEEGLSSAWGDRFRKPFENYRLLTIQDYTFLVNTDTIVEMDSTAAPAKSPVEETYIQIRASGSAAQYKIRLRAGTAECKVGSIVYMSSADTDPDASGAAKGGAACIGFTPGDWGAAFTAANCECAGAASLQDPKKGLYVGPSGTPNTGTRRVKAPNTDDIALDLAFKDDETGATPDYYSSGNLLGTGGPGTTPGNNGPGNHGLKYRLTVANALRPFSASTLTWPNNASNTVEVVGSMIRITSPTAFDEVELWDSFGGDAMRQIRATVDREANLPKDGPFQDGFRVRIKGDTVQQTDDYFLKFTADKAGTFGVGKWSESTDYGVLTRLKASTMPQQIVIKQDNSAGTVTGTPFEYYLEYGPLKQVLTGASWDDRLIGDDTLTPRPSFVGKAIQDLRLWQGRLCFLTPSSIVMSEVDSYFNFFRLKGNKLFPDDRIDTTPDRRHGYPFTHMKEIGNALVLFDGKSAGAIVSSELGVKLGSVRYANYFAMESVDLARPVELGRSVFIANSIGSYSTLHEIILSEESGSAFDREITEHVPTYIVGKPICLSASSIVGAVAIVTDTSQRYMYFMRLAGQVGERSQEAVCRYDVGATGKVKWCEWIGDTLYYLVERQYGFELESMRVAPKLLDVGATWLCYLDRRVNEDTPGFSKSVALAQTTITMPYRFDDGDTPIVCDRVTGELYVIQSQSTTTVGGVTVSTLLLDPSAKDLTQQNLWVGVSYLSRYLFNNPLVAYPVGNRAISAKVSGRTEANRAAVAYEDTNRFTARAGTRGATPQDDPFAAPSGNSDVIGTVAPYMDTGRLSTPLSSEAEDLDFSIESSDHRGFGITKVDWLAYSFEEGSRR